MSRIPHPYHKVYSKVLDYNYEPQQTLRHCFVDASVNLSTEYATRNLPVPHYIIVEVRAGPREMQVVLNLIRADQASYEPEPSPTAAIDRLADWTNDLIDRVVPVVARDGPAQTWRRFWVVYAFVLLLLLILAR